MHALLVGLGRAGRRHQDLLKTNGVQFKTVDIKLPADYLTISEALKVHHFDLAVIATPPHFHLEQIRECLEAGLFVLYEKPLCGWGQLPEAAELAKHPQIDMALPAFNYRFHPELLNAKKQMRKLADSKASWKFWSDQHRLNLPEWGLVLDHLPHTLDILHWLAGPDNEVTIRTAWAGSQFGMNWCYVRGVVSDCVFEINDRVFGDPTGKFAFIKGPFGYVEVNTWPEIAWQMFMEMYKSFLGAVAANKPELYPITYTDSLYIQTLLEEIQLKLRWGDDKSRRAGNSST